MKINIFEKKNQKGLMNFKNEIPHLNGQDTLISLIHHRKQIAYFKHELSLIGLDVRTVWDYSKGVIKDEKASPLTIAIDSFFYTVSDLVNYFIVYHTKQLKPITRMVFRDGSPDETYFSLHYFDKESVPMIIPFSFSTLGSSKLFKVNFFTKKPEFNQPIVFCGNVLNINKKDTDALDEYLRQRMIEFIPVWKKMMLDIHKIIPKEEKKRIPTFMESVRNFITNIFHSKRKEDKK